MKRTLIAPFVIVGLVAMNCSDERNNFLEGSIADTYDMKFDRTRIRLYTAELAIEYVKSSGTSQKIPIKVTLLTSANPVAGGTYNLMEMGTLSRGDGYESELPEMESASLDLDSYTGEDDSIVSGTFEARFVSSTGNVKSLWGGFRKKLEVVQLPGQSSMSTVATNRSRHLSSVLSKLKGEFYE